MRKIRIVLKYLYEHNYSNRKIAKLASVSRRVVADYQDRFIKSEIGWPLPPDLSDDELESRLFPIESDQINSMPQMIDFANIHSELKQPNATLLGLHEEIVTSLGIDNVIGYSQFTRQYKKFKNSLRISLRQTYPHGEVVFVDYSGKTLSITDRKTGELQVVQIFVGVLGASLYTYAEATLTQKLHDWIESHCKMFEYFGGVPLLVVPDNLRSAVTKADRFFPIVNESYKKMCEYYGTEPFPARAYKPKDKSRAEAAVLLVQRWILFKLRKRKFFSLYELNVAIRDLLEGLNHKPFQKLHGSRFSLWIEHERFSLQPLPLSRYETAEWGKVRAGADYHVSVGDHIYSVPHIYKLHELEYRLTNSNVEIFFKGKIIATHSRSFEKSGCTTDDAHQTSEHKAVTNWSFEDSLDWAKSIGVATNQLFELQLPKLNNKTFGYRFLNAIKSLEKKYGSVRFEEACKYAVENKIYDTSTIKRILARNLDRLLSNNRSNANNEKQENVASSEHENIRGAEYFQKILNEEDIEKENLL